MEASALRHTARVPVLTGLSPHLRLQSDERLIALVRRGHQGAFEVLLKRYQPRLLAFCRHMVGSNEDAEDVLQEVFASAYNAMCLDDRPIRARPWLYRIARNRCLNHLRRPQDAGQESMDVFERESGATAADTVHRREEFRQIVTDVHELPETQRTALLLREIDTLSYEQIADAMETTVPSVKSLLVRARMSLAEAAEARQLTCGEVRLQLTQAAEGLGKASPPTRRHVRSCQRCRSFRRELRRTSHALGAVYPIGAAAGLKALIGGGSAGLGKGAGAGSGVAGGAALGGAGAAGVLSVATGSVVTKAAAGLLAAALVTAGAFEVRSGGGDRDAVTASSPAPVAPTDDRLRPPPPLAVPTHQPRRHHQPVASHQPAPGPAATVEPAQARQPEPAEPVAAPEPAATAPVVQTATPPQEVPPPAPVVQEEPAAPTTEGVTPPSGSSGEGSEGFPGVTPAPSGSASGSGSGSSAAPPPAGSSSRGGGSATSPESGFAGVG